VPRLSRRSSARSRLSAIYAKQGTIAEHWYVACCTALELGPRAFRVQLKIRRLACGSERPSSKYLKAGLGGLLKQMRCLISCD